MIKWYIIQFEVICNIFLINLIQSINAMNYIFIIFLSLLVPYTFDMANIKYTQDLGFTISDQIEQTKWNVRIVETSNTTQEIRKTPTSGGFYAITYEFFTQFNINLTKNIWFAPRLSFSPLREGVDVILVSKNSTSPGVPTRMYYNEKPGIGVILGYDLFSYGEFGKNYYAIAPYTGITLLRVAYSGASDFTTNEYLDSVAKFHFGAKISLGQEWSFISEYTFYNLNYFNIDGLSDRLIISVNKIKFGVSYSFLDPRYYHKANKDDAYHDIIKSIDPNIDYKVQERKRLEKRALENEKRQQRENPDAINMQADSVPVLE